MGAAVAQATLTRKIELTNSWLTELMYRPGCALEGKFRVSHLPVLLDEAIQGLLLQEGGVYVDGTTGELSLIHI